MNPSERLAKVLTLIDELRPKMFESQQTAWIGMHLNTIRNEVIATRASMLPPPLPAGTRIRINDPPQPGVDREEEHRFRAYQHGDEGFVEGRTADGQRYRIEINGKSGIMVHVTDLEVIL